MGGMVKASACPHCGAPIYAPLVWDADEAGSPAPVNFSCVCRHRLWMSTVTSPARTRYQTEVPAEDLASDVAFSPATRGKEES